MIRTRREARAEDGWGVWWGGVRLFTSLCGGGKGTAWIPAWGRAADPLYERLSERTVFPGVQERAGARQTIRFHKSIKNQKQKPLARRLRPTRGKSEDLWQVSPLLLILESRTVRVNGHAAARGYIMKTWSDSCSKNVLSGLEETERRRRPSLFRWNVQTWKLLCCSGMFELSGAATPHLHTVWQLQEKLTKLCLTFLISRTSKAE